MPVMYHLYLFKSNNLVIDTFNSLQVAQMVLQKATKEWSVSGFIVLDATTITTSISTPGDVSPPLPPQVWVAQ